MIPLMEPLTLSSQALDQALNTARRQEASPLLDLVPPAVRQAGASAAKRFLEFFTAHIRNPNTRTAYARAVRDFFRWCEPRGIGLAQLEPMLVAAYIEQHPGSAPSKKQALAAIRMLLISSSLARCCR